MDFCNVNHLWTTVRNAITGALDSITLADLAVPRVTHPFHPSVITTVATTPITQAKDA
jgi:DNA-binding IscR family transcriptional regulator